MIERLSEWKIFLENEANHEIMEMEYVCIDSIVCVMDHKTPFNGTLMLCGMASKIHTDRIWNYEIYANFHVGNKKIFASKNKRRKK
jgi:hypothetical protein